MGLYHPSMLRVLSFNAGLLRWKVGPWTAFENPRLVEGRAKRVVEALKSERFDVLCIQECYDDGHYREIADGFSSTHPHAARIKSGGFRFHNGLAVLSRFKIAEASLHPHRAATLAERIVATKAMLSVVLEVSGVGRVSVINVHLSAGLKPTSDAVVAVRGKQIEELKQLAGQMSVVGGAVCVLAVGDFNAGPEAAPANYADIVDAGFNDAWTEAQGGAAPGHTWDTSNDLNSRGIHGGCAAQRCDHIFYCSSGGVQVEVSDCRIACTDRVRLDSGHFTNVSDHYAVVATIKLRGGSVLAPKGTEGTG